MCINCDETPDTYERGTEVTLSDSLLEHIAEDLGIVLNERVWIVGSTGQVCRCNDKYVFVLDWASRSADVPLVAVCEENFEIV